MNYKRIFAMAVLLCSFAIGLQAQETPEFGYLLGGTNGKVKVSGFGAYTIGFSQYDGNLAVYNGGGGAVLLNQTVYFGLYGTGLSTRHKQSDFMITAPDNTLINYDNVVTTFGHGGFGLGISMIHTSQSILEPVQKLAGEALGLHMTIMSTIMILTIVT